MGLALDQLELLNTSEPSSRFLGRLDMQRIGVFGHSLGGATSLQFCHDDSRFKAGVDIDGAPLGSIIGEGVTQPFMFLISDHGNESDPETRQIKSNISSIYDRLLPGQRFQIKIRGANHFGFSDDGALLKSPLLMSIMRTLGILRLEGRRQLAVTAHCITSFFNVHLKGASLLELKSQSSYPEIEFIPWVPIFSVRELLKNRLFRKTKILWELPGRVFAVGYFL